MAILFGAPVTMPGDVPAGAGEPHGSQSPDFEALAARHVEKGYAAGYAPKAPFDDPASIAAARDAFAAAGVRIAEVGCWVNLLADDRGIRERSFERMAEALFLADELEAGCAITTVGSVRPEGVDHRDARNYSAESFAQTVATARKLIDRVQPSRAKLTFEALASDFTDTPTGVRELIEAIDRPEVAAHVDLANWLTTSPRRYWEQEALIEEMVDQLGPWIIAGHCKDAVLRDVYETLLVEVPPGHGHLDLSAYLQALDSLPRDITLLLEHLPDEAAYDAAGAHVRAVAEAAGVSLIEPSLANGKAN